LTDYTFKLVTFKSARVSDFSPYVIFALSWQNLWPHRSFDW